MDEAKIIQVTQMYQERFLKESIKIKRITTSSYFGVCTNLELLQHAHHLSNNVCSLVNSSQDWGKINRHFTAMQMCISFAGWYTLDELMDHNRF